MAVIGQPLASPEAGWKRIKYNDSMFAYSETTSKWLSNGSITYVEKPTLNNVISFNFSGTKIRIIGRAGIDNQNISIDGVVYKFNGGTNNSADVLQFEKINLADTQHYVKIWGVSATGYIRFSGVDIDEAKKLYPYNEYPFFEKILIQLGDDTYKKWSNSWQTVTTTTPTSQDYIDNGMESTDVEAIPLSAWQELNGQDVKLAYYTDNSSTTEITIETETEPYSIYDEFGDTMEVLYYTDDPDKNKADLEITANYSPLDEIEGDFEVVTWTDTLEEVSETMIPTFDSVIEDGSVYATEVDLTDVIRVE